MLFIAVSTQKEIHTLLDDQNEVLLHKVISLLLSPTTPALLPDSRGNNRGRQGERAGVGGAGSLVARAE